MKILNPRIHGILDYVVVVAFLLSPTLFGLTGLAATLAYVLAAVHLTMTLITDFPAGVASIVPLPIHGMVELVVAITLVVLPWLIFSADPVGRTFYVAAGVIIFVTWLITDYRGLKAPTV